MLKKLLLCILFIGVLLLMSCEIMVKQCTYEVYQQGERLDTECITYQRVSEYCKDHSKDGLFYKLIDVKMVDIRKVKH